MTRLFQFAALLNALEALAVGGIGYWRNRHQTVGWLAGLAMLGLGLWLFAFSWYFVPLAQPQALRWAKVTLTFGILATPVFLHLFCVMAERSDRMRWWIVACYATGVFFTLALWCGSLIAGLKPTPYMDHYIRYNRSLYPWMTLHISGWQVFGAAVLIQGARKAVGYKRTQLTYFMVAWLIAFVADSLIVIPAEYGLYIVPFGFFILPFNLVLLGYVMSKERLADYNVVIARVFLYVVTMVIIAGATLVFLGGLALVAPGFMNQQQLTFAFMLSMTIGVGLTASLPRLLPRAERMMQERMFGKRYGYQDTLANLVKDLSRMPTIDQVLAGVASTVHAQMQLSRVLVLMQDPLANTYKVEAESGLNARELSELGELGEDSSIIHYLHEKRDVLVRDELPRLVPAPVMRALLTDLDRLRVSVCVPMMADDRLVGLIALGEKLSRDMFFVSDLRVLERLATEVALAAKYRRMEEQVFRKNRLAELGTIAAGVAHEIRNPLASIKTFAQLMPERMDDPEFKNEFSKLVQKDVDRITKVIESMLAFARPAQVTIGEHLANDLVEEAILLVQSRLKDKRIELTRQFHGDPVIKVDKHQMLQVLVNILSNAADALQERGKIRVATGVRQLDIGDDGNKNRNYAVIEVADNGPGIPAAVRSRLFDPFFTTKKGGTGLGLSISQKIVRDHGGAITISSVEGKGTSFHVNLPLK